MSGRAGATLLTANQPWEQMSGAASALDPGELLELIGSYPDFVPEVLGKDAQPRRIDDDPLAIVLFDPNLGAAAVRLVRLAPLDPTDVKRASRDRMDRARRPGSGTPLPCAGRRNVPCVEDLHDRP